MVNRYFFLLLNIVTIVHAMEEDTVSHSTYVIDVTSTHRSRRGSEQDAEQINRAVTYYLGASSPHLQQALSSIIKPRLRESADLQEEFHRVPFDMEWQQLYTNDDQVRRYVDIKRIIGESVEKAIKDRDDDIADFRLQLQLKDKDISLATKKLYAALATSGLSLAGVIITFVATYLSMNHSS